MRVKVREYIYYTRKNLKSQEQGHQRQGLQGADGGQGHAEGQHRHREGVHSQWNGVPTHSRFDVLNSRASVDQP